MSQVRMCDRCRTLFCEGEEGSATGTVNVAVKGNDGVMRMEVRVQDLCGVCTGGKVPEPIRVPELEVGKTYTREPAPGRDHRTMIDGERH